MVLVKAKSATFDSKCNREGCNHDIKTGTPYFYDTEAKKGYCSQECGEMGSGLKLTENGFTGKKGSTWTKPVQQLWRTPDEGITACKFWHETVIPMILETCKKLSPNSTTKNGSVDKKLFDQVSLLYAEIYLGKFQGGSKS